MKTDQSLMKLTPEATISQITATDEQAANLLASIGLSLSKHEDETLRSVCQQHQWSEKEVLQWVKKHSSSSNGEKASDDIKQEPQKEASLLEWTAYLEESFINRNRAVLAELNENFPRIRKVHGNQYSWLKDMYWHFKKFNEVLEMYYGFEQETFIPLIERLANGKEGNINHGVVKNLQKSFSVIEKDQARLQRLMKTIRNKGNQFENPAGACSTLRIQHKNFKILFSKLSNQFKLEREQLIPRVKKQILAKK